MSSSRDAAVAERKALFLDRLAMCGDLKESCNAAGITGSTPFRWAVQDGDFATEMDALLAAKTDELINRAHGLALRQARNGDPRLLIALIKRRDEQIERVGRAVRSKRDDQGELRVAGMSQREAVDMLTTRMRQRHGLPVSGGN